MVERNWIGNLIQGPAEVKSSFWPTCDTDFGNAITPPCVAKRKVLAGSKAINP